MNELLDNYGTNNLPLKCGWLEYYPDVLGMQISLQCLPPDSYDKNFKNRNYLVKFLGLVVFRKSPKNVNVTIWW